MTKEKMQTMRKKMQNLSQEQKMAMRSKMVEKMKKSGMRAPAMSMVSARLKSQLKTRDEFIAFVIDYITNPSKEKALCMPMPMKVFGQMPAIGKAMSQEDKESVAKWLYDNYKDTGMCKMQHKNKAMKCSASKCSASMK